MLLSVSAQLRAGPKDLNLGHYPILHDMDTIQTFQTTIFDRWLMIAIQSRPMMKLVWVDQDSRTNWDLSQNIVCNQRFGSTFLYMWTHG